MSLTEGKNILVYVETAGDTPVGPALEILAKAKELAGAKGEKVIAAVLAKEPDAAARTAIEAGADEAVLTLKSLDAFAKAADGKATKIIIPSDLQGIAGLTKTIAEVARPDVTEKVD